MRIKQLVKAISIILAGILLVTSTTESTYAWNNKSKRSAYSYYYNTSLGNLEARIWVSTLKTNVTNTRVTFDAISSSWFLMQTTILFQM